MCSSLKKSKWIKTKIIRIGRKIINLYRLNYKNYLFIWEKHIDNILAINIIVDIKYWLETLYSDIKYKFIENWMYIIINNQKYFSYVIH